MPKLIFYRRYQISKGWLFDPGYRIELPGHFKKTQMPGDLLEVDAPVGYSEITIRYKNKSAAINIDAAEGDYFFIEMAFYKYQSRAALLSPIALLVGAIGESFIAFTPFILLLVYAFYNGLISKSLYIKIFKNQNPDTFDAPVWRDGK